MKKLLLLSVFALALQAVPVLADSHGSGEGNKGKMMEKVDANGDGEISKSEFLAHSEEKFAKMDANSDGTISKEEVKEARKEKRGDIKDRMKERRENAE